MIEDRFWAEGYTETELEVAQEKYSLVFPPDLLAFLRDRRPALSFDWRNDDQEIRDMLRRPLEGLILDVEQGMWWPEWGDRPSGAEERARIITDAVHDAPRLVPIFSHRYLPAEPNEVGNPIFSIVQSDAIYYGTDLGDYFEREFGHARLPSPEPTKRIRFWSDLVDRNGTYEWIGMEGKLRAIRERLNRKHSRGERE